MWQRLVNQVAQEYPEVTHDYQHIDAATIFVVTDPGRFDVILTDNLFGDILTDEAGAVVGGVGYSASGNINASNEYPSMFEPIHGSAPDIAGKGIANPTAAILSSAMLLRHLGLDEAASRIDRAVAQDIAQSGSSARNTEQVSADILARL
jgi:3-isopropylmalate dehydrogenase